MADVGVGRRGATTSWAAARMAAEEGPMELRNVNAVVTGGASGLDRKSTRLNSSHSQISYAVFCLKKKSTRLNSSHSQISYAVFCLKKKKLMMTSLIQLALLYLLAPMHDLHLAVTLVLAVHYRSWLRHSCPNSPSRMRMYRLDCATPHRFLLDLPRLSLFSFFFFF